MKPANFPGRVLARRRTALRKFPGPKSRKGKRTQEQYVAEVNALQALCDVTDDYARGVRSKKDHSHRAKLRQL